MQFQQVIERMAVPLQTARRHCSNSFALRRVVLRFGQLGHAPLGFADQFLKAYPASIEMMTKHDVAHQTSEPLFYYFSY